MTNDTEIEIELLDIFRNYDGDTPGVRGLSEATGITEKIIYHIAQGAHRRMPTRQLEQLAEAVCAVSKSYAGTRVSRTSMLTLWKVMHAKFLADHE